MLVGYWRMLETSLRPFGTVTMGALLWMLWV